MNDLLYSFLLTSGFTIIVLVVFVILYWGIRGFLPGSRVIELPLVQPNGLDTKSATFKIFHVKWCPYSRDAVDAMKQFQGLIDERGYTYGNKHVEIAFVDCDSKKKDCSLYNVDAYPTYKLETHEKMYEYLGPANITAYRAFLVAALGKEGQS
jgi:hypothetical protein